ncbi:MAG: DMT family transporter [Lachnospiraceae bacterium]|nr:DMT family transporter [Lachnospiraceae bacterium]
MKDSKNKAGYSILTYKGMIYVAIAGMIFGAFPVFTSLFVLSGGNTDSFNFLGFLLSTILLIPIIIYRKTGFRLPKKAMIFVILAGIANVITRVLLTKSYLYLDVGVSTTLHFLYPIITAFLSFIIFKDRMPVYKWIVFAVACLSVSLFITGSSGEGSITGVILAVASSFGFASYMLIEEKAGLTGYDPFVILFYVTLVSCVGAFVFGLGSGELFAPIPAKAWVILFIVALVNNILGFALQLEGIKYLGAAMTAIFSLFEPIFSCIFGAVFLHEEMGARSVLGIVLILVSLLDVILLDNKYGNVQNE